jgi:hypothetical protein
MAAASITMVTYVTVVHRHCVDCYLPAGMLNEIFGASGNQAPEMLCTANCQNQGWRSFDLIQLVVQRLETKSNTQQRLW